MLFAIGDQSVWLVFKGVLEVSNGSFNSLEFFWPLCLSGSFESSFVSSNRVLVSNPHILKENIVSGIIGSSIGIVFDDLV